MHRRRSDPARAALNVASLVPGVALRGARRSLRSARVQVVAIAVLTLALLGLALLGSETGDEYCLRSYRTTQRRYRWAASWHNRLARGLHSVGLCGDWQQPDCRRLGRLLDGVEIYVIEMPLRANRVRTQASDAYGVSKDNLHTVPATTPESGPCQTLCPKISAECHLATQDWLGGPDVKDDFHRWPGPGERPRPFKVTEVHVAVAWSHLAAIQQACTDHSQGSQNKFALVLEDDADFGPLEHWPAPLSQMVQELPDSWTVLNVAPSNPDETGAAVSDALMEGRVFREAYMNVTKFQFSMDYGAVAVLYNLENPAVCDAAKEDPHTLMRNSEQICEPADMMLYRLIGGQAFENMYTARLPLFYFCSLGSALEKSMAGNDNDAGFNRLGYAMLQRSVWAQFTRRRVPAREWANGFFTSCSKFDLPYEERITNL